MNKQIKYLLGVLILMLIAAYFLSLLSGLPQYFKNDIIAFLEERFSGEISFSSVSLWPLNRLRLESFSFADQNGNLVKIEQLNLDYNFNFSDFDNLIKISFLEAKNAEIILTGDFSAVEKGSQSANLNNQNSEAGEFKLASFDLPKFLGDINVNLVNSKLTIKNEDYDLELSNLNLGAAAQSSKDYVLNLSTSILIDQLSYNNFKLNDFEAEKLELQLKRESESADLYFKTDNLAVNSMVNLLEQKNYNFEGFNIDLNTLTGLFSAKGEIKFAKNKILNYKSEIDFSELKMTAFYQRQNQSENFNLSFNDLKLVLSGPKFNLAAADNSFLLDDNLVDFSFKLDQNYQYQLELAAANFNYNYDLLKPELSSGNISFALKVEGDQQQIKRAQADITAENVVSKYAELQNSHLIVKLVDKEIFVEKAEFELANNSKLNLQASYNLQDGNYLLSAEAAEMKISNNLISLLEEYNLAADYLNQLRKIEDDSLDFILDIAGYYNHESGISAAGDLDFDFSFVEEESEIQLESKFWYTDQKLFFDSLKLISDFAYLDLLGEIDFAAENFDLRYAAKNIEPAFLNQLFDLNLNYLTEINPTINYIEGHLADSFSNPTFSLDLEMDELRYQNYVLKDIKMRADYADDKLELAEAKASVSQALLRAKGKITDLTGTAAVDFNIRSENLYFQDIAAAAGTEIPLTGQLQLNADLSGPLRDYDLDFSINTSNPAFTFGDREFELSNLSSNIKKENGNFKIENFSFKYQNLNFKADGIYNPAAGFDLNYQLTGLEIQSYLNSYPNLAEKITGSLNLNGSLNGPLEALSLNFKLGSEALYFDGFELDIQENNFEYSFQADQLDINQFNFSFASGSYQITGQAFDFNTVPQSKLNFKLLEVPTEEFFQKYLTFYPFAQEVILKGESEIETNGSEYNIFLDIAAYLGQSAQSSFAINGEIGKEIALNFSGSELPLAVAADQYGFNLDLQSDLDLSGNISGGLMTPVLNLSHTLTNIEINETIIESITGDILVENRRRFSASETVNFSEGGNLTLDGSYSLNDKQLSLTSDLQSLPLAFILSFFGEEISSDGHLNGNLRAEGNIDDLQFSGELAARGETLEVGIWSPIKNFEAEINFQNEKALLQNVNGQFGEGRFEIGGAFNLLDSDNFWDLTLTGQDLYFDYGSLTGNFDSQLSFSGSLQDPLLAGELQIFDFIIGIPFKWPAGGGKTGAEADGAGGNTFIPRIDLKLVPGNNVRVKNNNMDILVQNGDLHLDFNHRRENRLMMEGRLRSSEGRFTYYNSRFTLNSAEITFTPVDEGDIPNLLVNATTYAGGREINIILNGPANNMRISFSSNPEMTEEEILNLLSSRGALGSAIIGGENIGIQQIILQELIRIASGFLQENLISGIESDFKTVLSLDRIEIDTLQYGTEREVAIYLGKNLSQRFYLEYAAFFGEEERNNEISFQYRLNEITTLKGSYLGEDEYQITLENEIEF